MSIRAAEEESIEHVREGIYFVDPAACARSPRQVIRDGQVLERFLDYIFVPKPMEQLTLRQISVVNGLRQNLVDSHLIGPADAIVKAKFVRLISLMKEESVLEWCCWFDALALPPEYNWTGVDVDPFVIDWHTSRGRPCLDANSSLSRLDPESVDVIPAVFVFHFALTSSQLDAMARVIHHRGLILANVYRRQRRSRAALREAFERRGFNLVANPDGARLCARHEYWVASKGRDQTELSAIARTLEN